VLGRPSSTRIAAVLLTLVPALLTLSAVGDVAPASAKKSCGTFEVKGLLTDVRVVVNRGKVSCKAARGVMKKLFSDGPNRTIGVWDCIGPQTGFAQCDSGNRRITGHF
jgi:hypothetical protein